MPTPYTTTQIYPQNQSIDAATDRYLQSLATWHNRLGDPDQRRQLLEAEHSLVEVYVVEMQKDRT